MKSVHDGNSNYRDPGTCIQPGNSAPRFNWRIAYRILIHKAAHVLGAVDEDMCRDAKWPDSLKLFNLFNNTVPWFEEHYNSVRKAKAIIQGYPLDKLEPYGIEDVHNRLRYFFETPKRGQIARKYGPSLENPDHPDNTWSYKRFCLVQYGALIYSRVENRQTITMGEIWQWSNRKHLIAERIKAGLPINPPGEQP